MKTTIVTTTIFVPRLLDQYADNLAWYGHSNVNVIVIGDRKTPTETAEYCRRLNAERLACEYLDIEAQSEYLSPFPDLWAFLRFDSIQRRNVGMLKAYQDGADVVISIDDDNLVTSHDFIGHHQTAGQVRTMPSFSSSSGWFNVCSQLTSDTSGPFYHRGYPMEQRWNEGQHWVTQSKVTRRVAVNAGLWLDDPDIDALTRLYRQPRAMALANEAEGSFVLHPGTWCPFNSQNTAFARDVLPAYFLSPYVGRYDDIWGGYVVLRVAEHLGDVIAFGLPLVRQARNPHNLWRDLDAERNGMQRTSGLCDALRKIELQGRNYHDCTPEIVEGLERHWTVEKDWTESQGDERQRFIDGLKLWHRVFSQILPSGTETLAGQALHRVADFVG